jgi:hypothetical protein
MNKINKYFNLLLNIVHMMSLLVTKQQVSCVWSMNFDYIHERNNYSETESAFSKNLINFISY